MQRQDGETTALTPEESWDTIHATMDRARSSMVCRWYHDDTASLGRSSLAGASYAVCD